MKYLKINRNLSLILFACLILSVFSCTNDDKFTLSDESEVDFTSFGVDYNIGGQIPYIYNIKPTFFDFSNKEEAKISYDLVVTGDPAPSMEVFLSYSGSNGDLGPFSVGNFDVPAETVELTFVEAANIVGLELEDVATLDEFILTATSSTGTPATAQTVIAGCPSFLGGTYACKTTVTSQGAGIGWDDCAGNVWEGTVIFEEIEGGSFNILTVQDTLNPENTTWSDLSFGAYYACYETAVSTSLPGGDVALLDQCGKLSYTGASQWGEAYTADAVSLNDDGTVVTITWSNDYGEGGIAEITNPSGWPSDLRN